MVSMRIGAGDDGPLMEQWRASSIGRRWRITVAAAGWFIERAQQGGTPPVAGRRGLAPSCFPLVSRVGKRHSVALRRRGSTAAAPFLGTTWDSHRRGLPEITSPHGPYGPKHRRCRDSLEKRTPVLPGWKSSLKKIEIWTILNHSPFRADPGGRAASRTLAVLPSA
jgi:hypothetical protein